MLLKRLFGALTGGVPHRGSDARTLRFALVLVRPKQRVHMSVFREIVEVVQAGLTRLGYGVGVVEHQFVQDACNVIFASHVLSQESVGLVPADSILYNFEPIDPALESMQLFLRELAPRFQVWDYSRFNVRQLNALGCRDNVHYVPLGYTPELTRIASAEKQDIDVFFSGAVSPRRARVLEELKARGLNVVSVANVYGEQRDGLIARARVVLNVHYYEDTRILEVPRLFYLLANGKAVVTEINDGLEFEPDLLEAVMAVPYERLAEACRALVDDSVRREALENAGMRCMRARDETEILRAALAATLKAR